MPRGRIPAASRRLPRQEAIRAAVTEYVFTARKVDRICADYQLSAAELARAVEEAGHRRRSDRSPTAQEVEMLFAEGWSTARLMERFGLTKAEVNSLLGIRTFDSVEYSHKHPLGTSPATAPQGTESKAGLLETIGDDRPTGRGGRDSRAYGRISNPESGAG